MITVHNLRTKKPVEPWQVRVDRASVLGNPFYMESENQREEVCRKYEAYFNKKVSIKDDVKFMQELRRLYKLHQQYGKLELYCWCAPKKCHAETIKKFLEKYLKGDTE